MSNGHPQRLVHQGAPGKYGAWPVRLVNELGVEASIDIFRRLKVSQPFVLSDIINKYELDTRIWGTQTVGGGTVAHVPNESAIRMTVGAANGDVARLQTHNYFRYQAGKSLTIRQTLYNADAGQTNQIRRWGYFETGDGLFWQLSGTTLSVCRRTSTSGAPVEATVVAQAAWNVDKMDGSGPSRITLDLTKGNIFEIEISWLGVGPARFIVNGFIVHEFLHYNTIVGPYMKTANLPIRAEVINTAASTGSSLTYICSTVEANGGSEDIQEHFAAFNATAVSVGQTEIPVLSIRNKLTYAGQTNRAHALPTLVSIFSETGRAAFRVILNPTLTGASFASATARSTLEFDVAATAFSGGETLYQGLVQNGADRTLDMTTLYPYYELKRMRLDAFGTIPDVLSIVAIKEQSGTTNMKGSITWEEFK